jgi:hypothetical protein
MRFRDLRIAWSATCLIASVLLIGLWMRSYWHDDVVCYFHGTHCVGVESLRGHLLPFFIHGGNDYHAPRWHVFSGPPYTGLIQPRHLDYTEYSTNFSLPIRSFTWYKSQYYFSVSIPPWFLAILIAASGSISWPRWRFSYVGACQVIRAFTCLPSGG